MKRIQGIRYLMWIGSTVELLYFLSMKEQSVIYFICLILPVLQFLYLGYTEIRIVLPIRKLMRGLDDPENDSKLFTDIMNMPIFRDVHELIERYTDEKIRQNNAEIFNKQTELTALQSQINPHFLYNTLDTIRGQAIMDGSFEVANMIETLASFFRYSISRKGNLVTLRDELNNINNYMKIQQYRFNNRFSLDIEVDEEDERALDFAVPRLILQPIVENAILHGLEERTEDAEVTIEVTVTEDLIITVSDNGRGMQISELDLLNERIHSTNTKLEEDGENGKGTGIALPNINKRIELLYGKKYGLNVFSSIGHGTDVEITIPVRNHAEEMSVEENSAKNQ